MGEAHRAYDEGLMVVRAMGPTNCTSPATGAAVFAEGRGVIEVKVKDVSPVGIDHNQDAEPLESLPWSRSPGPGMPAGMGDRSSRARTVIHQPRTGRDDA